MSLHATNNGRNVLFGRITLAIFAFVGAVVHLLRPNQRRLLPAGG